MRLFFSILALLVTTALLSACSSRQPMMSRQTDNAVIVLTNTGVLSENDRTPETTDSLEAGDASSGTTVMHSLTASGTIVSGDPINAHRLIVFADEDCLYCRHFMTDDLPWILQDMVAGDKLAIERVFLPMSAAGENAAKLAICAAEQNKFPEADRWLSTHGIETTDQKNFAKKIGLNLKKLVLCNAKKDLLAGNLRKAKENGVERVPFFVLGSDSWLGLMTKEKLKERLEFNLR